MVRELTAGLDELRPHQLARADPRRLPRRDDGCQIENRKRASS